MISRETTLMNGRLGSNIELSLVGNTRIIDTSNELVVKLRASKIKDIDNTIQLQKEKLTVLIKLGEKTIYKEPLILDFKYKDDLELVNFKNIYNVEETKILNLSATIIVSDNKSGYLEDTTVNTTITFNEVKDEILFIDLTGSETEEEILCTFVTSLEPELIEFKTNDDDWCRLSNGCREFTIPKTNKNQYIQVRGKFKNKYSYSNVLKIYK